MEKAFPSMKSLYCLPQKHGTDKNPTKILLRQVPCRGNPAITSDRREQRLCCKAHMLNPDLGKCIWEESTAEMLSLHHTELSEFGCKI